MKSYCNIEVLLVITLIICQFQSVVKTLAETNDFVGTNVAEDTNEFENDDDDGKENRNDDGKKDGKNDENTDIMTGPLLKKNLNRNKHQSKRRTTTNPDRSKTTIGTCFDRKSVSRNNNFKMCKMCSARTVHPPNVYPRYISEIICDRETICFTGEGRCRQNYFLMEFRKDRNLIGFHRFNEWSRYIQKIRSGCSCEALKSGLLANLI